MEIDRKYLESQKEQLQRDVALLQQRFQEAVGSLKLIDYMLTRLDQNPAETKEVPSGN